MQIELPSLLMFIALVLVACTMLKKFTVRLGVPSLLAFMVLGMVFGSDGIFKISFSNYEMVGVISTATLVIIMFYGGFGTNWKVARPVASLAILLSSVGTVATAALVGVFCYFVLGMPILEGLLCGALLSSTDAAAVFSILRSRNLALKENTASLLEVESGSNDPFAYMLTVLILTAIESGITVGEVGVMFVHELGIGLVFGFGIGLLARWIVERDPFDSSESVMFFIVAVALAGYAVPQYLGGTGFLSVYIVGLLLGNCEIPERKSIVPFFDGVTGILESLLFFLLGLLSYPSKMVEVILPALAVALFLTFVARPLITFILMTPFGGSMARRVLVSFVGLRGLASIVFAITVVSSPATLENDLFHIVFVVVLFSIAFQGSLLSWVAKKLNMVDEGGNVLKTFTDYVDETPVNFIQFRMEAGHEWINKQVKDIVLPPGSILVTLHRGEEDMVPKGKTLIMEDDVLVLCALEEGAVPNPILVEKIIEKDDFVPNMTLADLPNRPHSLIVLVQRGHEYIIPDGSTVLELGDKVLITYSKEAAKAAAAKKLAEAK